MTPSDSFSSFRADVAAPSPAVRDAARARLMAAIEREGHARRITSPRGLGVAFAAVAALAVVAFALTAILDGGTGVIERAEAAIDPQGRILHVVVRIEAADGSVTRGESWVRPDGTGRSLERSGSGLADCTSSETELRCFDAARNVVDVYRYNPEAVEGARRNADLPGFRVDQPESIHRAFGAGYARLVGETEIGGRAVYEIELATPFVDPDGNAMPRFDLLPSPVLYLDRETYYPVAQRFPDAGSTTFYETYEFLPLGPEMRELLELPTNGATRVVVHPVGEGPQS